MASEDFVSFHIMRFLQHHGWSIMQYHPPGGQACFGIIVEGKLVFSDTIAYKNGKVLTLENKGRFSSSDVTKLRHIKNDPGAIDQLTRFTKTFCQNHCITPPGSFELYWAHGCSERKCNQSFTDICIFYVSESGLIRIVNTTENCFLV